MPEGPSQAMPIRTVVVRAGPAPPRGTALDWAVGILGALVLAGAVVLADVLPQDPVYYPQFRVTVEDVDVDFTAPPEGVGSQSRYLNESETWTLSFAVPDDNIHSIEYILEFVEDIPASDYDQFDVELRDPAGNSVGGKTHKVSNIDLPAAGPEVDPGTLDPNDPGSVTGFLANASSGEYEPQLVRAVIREEVTTRPGDDIVKGRTTNESAEEAMVRLRQQAQQATRGTWTLSVTMSRAGDCPNPAVSPSPERTQRAAACLQHPDADNGVDHGNLVTVTEFKYTYFSLEVAELS